MRLVPGGERRGTEGLPARRGKRVAATMSAIKTWREELGVAGVASKEKNWWPHKTGGELEMDDICCHYYLIIS